MPIRKEHEGIAIQGTLKPLSLELNEKVPPPRSFVCLPFFLRGELTEQFAQEIKFSYLNREKKESYSLLWSEDIEIQTNLNLDLKRCKEPNSSVKQTMTAQKGLEVRRDSYQMSEGGVLKQIYF